MIELKNVSLTIEQADLLAKWGLNVLVKTDKILLERA